MLSHSPARMGLIIVGFICYIICLGISYSSSGNFNIFGIFKSDTGTLSDKYFLTVTPADWTFGLVWALIFIYQAVWYVYVLTTICRKDNEGRYLYTLSILPPAFFIVFFINNVVVVGWLVLWDREYIYWALIDIVFTPLTLYICLLISFRGLYNNIETLQKGGAGKEVWFVRCFVQNGLAFFATWLSIATLLNFGVVLTYTWAVDIELSGTVVLAILSLDIIVWFTLDVFVFDKFVRYTISPYIVLVVALSGSLAKNFDLDANYRNSIFTTILLALSGILLIFKLALIIMRHIRYPIKGNSSYEVKGTLA